MSLEALYLPQLCVLHVNLIKLLILILNNPVYFAYVIHKKLFIN